MPKPQLPLDRYVGELRQDIIAAALNFDVWWTYKQRRDRRRFIGVLNAYPTFFQTSLHAHFVALVIALYRIYEPRDDTFNLRELIQRVEAERFLTGRPLAGLKRRVANAEALWRKVAILRNNVFGHKSIRLTSPDAFKRANVSGNDFRELIRRTKTILNTISHSVDQSVHAFNLRATWDTRKVLRDLRRKP